MNQMGLTLTEHLALDRNRLANERTWLAWLRTALTFLVAGVTLIQFFQYRMIVIVGFCLIPVSLFIVAFGYIRFLRMKKKIGRAAKEGVSGYLTNEPE